MRTITIFFIALLCMACKSHYATNYKLVTKERSYYTNKLSYVNDSIMFYETDRRGNPKAAYTIPFKETKIISSR
jgi:hypothetical protein